MNAPYEFVTVSPGEIDLRNTLTNFSLSPVPSALQTSIKEIGITHPVALVRRGERYHVICGHRRVRAAQALAMPSLPARLLSSEMMDEEMLKLNLIENSAHRRYSDIETGSILFKLRRAEAGEERIIDQYMPIIGLERSKKLFRDFLEAETFGEGLKQLLHELKVPIRIYSVMFRWDAESREKAEAFFAALRPGVNKWRELLELIDETCRRDGLTPAALLERQDIQSALQNGEPSVRYGKVHQVLYQWRFPTLCELRKEVWLALDKLKLDGKIKLRAAENFESGEIKIELKFKSQEELLAQVDRLSQAARTDSMKELIRVFKDLS